MRSNFFAFAFLCECNNDDGNDDVGDDDDGDNDDSDDDDGDDNDGDDDDGNDDDIVGDLHFLVLVELLVRHDGGGGVVGGLQQDRQSIYYQNMINIWSIYIQYIINL